MIASAPASCLEAKPTGLMRTLSDLDLVLTTVGVLLDFMKMTDDNDLQLMLNQKGPDRFRFLVF
jgi:hypothetical protein